MRFRVVKFGLAGASVALVIGGCHGHKKEPASRQASLDPTPYTAMALEDGTPVTPEAWRPAWWIDRPVHNAWGVSAAAFGTDRELLESRRKAVDAAGKALAQAQEFSSGGGMPDAPAGKADTIRLTDGSYRTFVLLTGKPKGP